MSMRSPRGFAAAIVLLSGVALAAFAVALGHGAEAIVHLALGASFLLIAPAVFDFRLPTWLTWAAGAAIGGLAVVFLLQGASDLTGFVPLTHLAYDILGQRLEKVLGYAFLLWCVAVVLIDSDGNTKRFGIVVVAAVLGVEIYAYAIAYLGGAAAGILKLLYLPLFVWLLLESRKPRPAA
ncbi:MAG: hypothetical protein WD036_02670 [Bauldia sp.]